MEYILSHGRIAVAEMEIDEETAAISKIGTVFAPAHVPVGISFRGNQPDRGDLNDWWQGRSIPASRQNIREALKNLGVTSTTKLLAKCFGLSLSDQYWINPVRYPLVWDKINFFDNPFSEDVGGVLFGYHGACDVGDNNVITRKINLLSPDNTSDGWLKKRWIITGGKRRLVKGGSDPYRQQPLNEAMAASIMKRLSVPHVPYSVVWENGFPYSVCDNFITSETELISAYYIHNTMKIKDANFLYGHYLECSARLGIPDAEIRLDQMLAVDYLIANTDRHLNNFGAVRNAGTLEWIMPAPLYDSGTSFWCNQTEPAIRETCKNISQPFRDTHEEQIKLAKNLSWINFGNLEGADDEFNALLSKSPLIDVARRDALCHALRERIKSLRNIS
jgi:hypothetical protein